MRGNKLFVDTNILLYFLKGESEVIEMLADKDLIISFVTELELLSFPKISPNSEEVIQGLLKNCSIIDLTAEIKELIIRFRRESKLKLPDAIVAATACYLKLPLPTADKQF
ncbi:type II toxin-antitoxin system VapC family toxin [Adhaeribacter arboris]|uniref:type II toxin-antitoxin system VapC family toxin n=1 Tax=Adhaeribacter arboris TaxID=2072846 RepID=UPI001E282F25|nr:type II toxin-antitoxin system VapC family toxin [Adhaeribacter arboris]